MESPPPDRLRSHALAPPPREVALTLRGARVVLRGDRSMYWPERRWLVVADLHLGKAESLRRDGIALPDAVMAADLARLRLAVSECGAERILVLGDLVHDAPGLTSTMVRRVAAWRASIDCEIALIPGNHDRRVAGLPKEWGVDELQVQLVEPPFVFSHEPLSALGGDAPFNWHGHIHPVRTVRGGIDRARLPVFAIGDRGAILPAFSTLTGGSECSDDPRARLWCVVEGRIVALPTGDRGEEIGG